MHGYSWGDGGPSKRPSSFDGVVFGGLEWPAEPAWPDDEHKDEDTLRPLDDSGPVNTELSGELACGEGNCSAGEEDLAREEDYCADDMLTCMLCTGLCTCGSPPNGPHCAAAARPPSRVNAEADCAERSKVLLTPEDASRAPQPSPRSSSSNECDEANDPDNHGRLGRNSSESSRSNLLEHPAAAVDLPPGMSALQSAGDCAAEGGFGMKPDSPPPWVPSLLLGPAASP